MHTVMHTPRHRSLFSLAHHNSEDVLCSGLIVQPVCRIDDSRTWVDPEQSHTDWVHTTVYGETQTGALIHV